MKTSVFVAFGVIFSMLTASGENLVKDFEVNNEKLFPEFRYWGQKGLGRLSQYVEDKTWNRCLKLEQLDYRIDPKSKKRSLNLCAIIGGEGDKPGFLSPPCCKPLFSPVQRPVPSKK